jgi:uncharacterized membrane protein YedE/YeeE
MNHFTPVTALLGGALIGLAATALLLFNGRIAGVSGILGALVRWPTSDGDTAWRWLFIAGLVSGGVVVRFAHADAFGGPGTSLPALWLAGLLVGIGSRVALGCTSGHGVCGTARFSPLSIAVTATFIVTGAMVVFALRRLGLS